MPVASTFKRWTVVWLFCWELWRNVYSDWHWWQTTEISLHKWSLVNHWVYYGYYQEHEWLSFKSGMVLPVAKYGYQILKYKNHIPNSRNTFCGWKKITENSLKGIYFLCIILKIIIPSIYCTISLQDARITFMSFFRELHEKPQNQHYSYHLCYRIGRGWKKNLKFRVWLPKHSSCGAKMLQCVFCSVHTSAVGGRVLSSHTPNISLIGENSMNGALKKSKRVASDPPSALAFPVPTFHIMGYYPRLKYCLEK